MDRRQKRTRNAIVESFSELMNRKKYESITVQDIIDEADIGRSTFYAHFETKDELLSSMCKEIFEHIFSKEIKAESDHDFSNQGHMLKKQLIHLLYHLKTNKNIVCNILGGNSKYFFIDMMKEYLMLLFLKEIEPNCNVDKEYYTNHLVCDFSELLCWWAKREMAETPERMIELFYSTNIITLD